MVGLARTEGAMHAGGAGIVTPSILGTVSASVNSTNPHTTNTISHTVATGTELLLLVALYGPADNTTGGEDTPSSDVDGNFTVISPASFAGGTGSGSNPTFALWGIFNPTPGSHNITYGRALGFSYSAIIPINLKDLEPAAPFGLLNVRVAGTAAADSDTWLDNITTEHPNSLVIVGGAWQGDDAAPITEDEDLVLLLEGTTGVGTTNEASFSIATKVGPAIPGTVTGGMTASVSDDYAYFMVEIPGFGV